MKTCANFKRRYSKRTELTEKQRAQKLAVEAAIYVPTEAEIEEACRLIQSAWSESDRYLRLTNTPYIATTEEEFAGVFNEAQRARAERLFTNRKTLQLQGGAA